MEQTPYVTNTISYCESIWAFVAQMLSRHKGKEVIIKFHCASSYETLELLLRGGSMERALLWVRREGEESFSPVPRIDPVSISESMHLTITFNQLKSLSYADITLRVIEIPCQ